MVKTRSQTGKLGIKKEEEDRKPALLLHSCSNTRTHNKCAKRKPSKDKDRRLRTQQVKVEEDTDIKSLLQSTPKSLKPPKRQQKISQEQINQLIDHVVNHGMSVSKASRMAKMCFHSGRNYYNQYKNDPEKKIPAPRNRTTHPSTFPTQEQIKNLIKYIDCDKITIKEASAKANMSCSTGSNYYNLYKNDPEKKIPAPRNRATHPSTFPTQEQIKNLIKYIDCDKMTPAKASVKANMYCNTGRNYYNLYKNDPEKKIPAPRTRLAHPPTFPTQEKIKNLINYINFDKITIKEASEKANMSYKSGIKYYNKYLNDPNQNLPAPPLRRPYTQDRKNELIGYIVNEKMTIGAASRKANVSAITGRRYYHKFLDNQEPGIPVPSHINHPISYTKKQIKEVISYIVDDKMTVKAASRKANMTYQTVTRHYRQYLKDNNMELPVPKSTKPYTPDKINELIGYIVNDKMNVNAASKKANIAPGTGKKYYLQYLKKHNLDPYISRYITQDKIDKLVGYVVDDKMSITKAAKKAKVSKSTGLKYYLQYLKDNKMEIPVQKHYTQGEKNELLGYIVDDKMTIMAASKKVNMNYDTGRRYYRQYKQDLKDQKQ